MYGNETLAPFRFMSANQPAKLYPARVGSVGADTKVVSVVVEPEVTNEPPLEL